MAGPGRFITDIDYMVKMKYILIYNSYRKKNSSFRDIALFENPICLLKEALDCEPARNKLWVNLTNTQMPPS